MLPTLDNPVCKVSEIKFYICIILLDYSDFQLIMPNNNFEQA